MMFFPHFCYFIRCFKSVQHFGWPRLFWMAWLDNSTQQRGHFLTRTGTLFCPGKKQQNAELWNLSSTLINSLSRVLQLPNVSLCGHVLLFLLAPHDSGRYCHVDLYLQDRRFRLCPDADLKLSISAAFPVEHTRGLESKRGWVREKRRWTLHHPPKDEDRKHLERSCDRKRSEAEPAGRSKQTEVETNAKGFPTGSNSSVVEKKKVW